MEEMQNVCTLCRKLFLYFIIVFKGICHLSGALLREKIRIITETSIVANEFVYVEQ